MTGCVIISQMTPACEGYGHHAGDPDQAQADSGKVHRIGPVLEDARASVQRSSQGTVEFQSLDAQRSVSVPAVPAACRKETAVRR